VDWFTLSYLWTHWSTIENHNKNGISWPSKRLAIFYACTLTGSITISIPLRTYQYCFTQHNEQITLPELELPVCISSSHHFFLLGYFPNWESNLHFHFVCSSVAPQCSYSNCYLFLDLPSGSVHLVWTGCSIIQVLSHMNGLDIQATIAISREFHTPAVWI